MNVALIQTDLIWESAEANRIQFEKKINELSPDVDLVVLPEMFSTGFSMNSAILAETMKGPTVEWMKELASSFNFSLCGSLIIKENESFYNRLLFVKPEGEISCYDKGHLFRMEKENDFFTKGSGTVITELKKFRLNLQICYDLRFPVWSRCRDNNYDVLIYVANWPESRRDVWNTLLIARALENQAYVIGVNRIGKDNNGISYSGDSVIIGPKGEVLASLNLYEEGIITCSLSLPELEKFRSKFPVWKDADRFTLD